MLGLGCIVIGLLVLGRMFGCWWVFLLLLLVVVRLLVIDAGGLAVNSVVD